MLISELHERRDRFRAEGRCVDCGVQVVPGRTRCEHHLDYHQTRKARLRRERRAKGLCIACGRKLAFKAGLCVGHYLAQVERWAKYRSKHADKQ